MSIFFGCLELPLVETTIEEEEKVVFDVNAPASFDWNCISNSNIVVSFKQNDKITAALDNTVVELYNEDDELLDALTVYDGVAEFNVRISSASTMLKFVSVATGLHVDVGNDVRDVEFKIKDTYANSFSKVDTDGDGLFDQFDCNRNNENVSIVVNNVKHLKSTSDKSTSSASYAIFEDLWPAKGDYDFNDLVTKTTFSWTRVKSNYIDEISGVCDVEWIGAGMQIGLGFELFEASGNNLYYLDEVISNVSGVEIGNSVKNGIIVVNNVHDKGLSSVEFTIKIKDKQFKNFVCIPYLFRTSNRTHQVRPFGAPPTQNQDMLLFRSNNDASPRSWEWETGNKFKYPLSGSEAFYRTAENHPWVIEFISKKKFKPSKETETILSLYPGFKEWAESGGNKKKEWYDNPVE